MIGQSRNDTPKLIVLALVGLLGGLVLILGMGLAGYAELNLGAWSAAAVATAASFGGLALVARLGWHRRIPGDPQFIYIPMLCTLLLLGLYMYAAPQVRLVPIIGWFVAILFLAGTAGLRQVVVLGLGMGIVHMGVAWLLWAEGHEVSLGLEAGIGAIVVLMSFYAGLVLERLRKERIETTELRHRLNELAMTDALTELANRRHFEQVLRAELDRVRRHGGTCSVAMLDVDFFKHYNDAVGHMAGDRLLRELAAVMRREVRLHDMVARYGGEEFSVILVHAGKEEAYRIIDRLRKVVEEYPFRQRDIQPTGRITVSGGIATCPEDAITYNDLMGKADEALYGAKRSGRNQVRVAGALTDATG